VVAIADVNADGVLDAVTGNVSAGNISVLLGDGLGGFGAGSIFPVSGGPVQVALGDVNADGVLDAVTANRFTNDLSVLLGDGLGSFGPGSNIPSGVTPDHETLASR
jgi:hypothetical protein